MRKDTISEPLKSFTVEASANALANAWCAKTCDVR